MRIQNVSIAFRPMFRSLSNNVVTAHSGKNRIKNKTTEIERAKIIKRTLGTKVAALYLKNRNWSIEASLFILTGQ